MEDSSISNGMHRSPEVLQPASYTEGVQQYKIVFAEQLATGLQVWREPLKQMRIPKMFDLRSDPFEAGEDSIRYNDWFVEHVPFQYAAQAVVHQWLESFKEFPPRQKAASFTVDQIVEKLMPKS